MRQFSPVDLNLTIAMTQARNLAYDSQSSDSDVYSEPTQSLSFAFPAQFYLYLRNGRQG